MDDNAASNRPTVAARLAGLVAYNDQRKQSSREGLLIAASTLFCARGYAAVSVEEITSKAGVSRVTFYRHFTSKTAVALELFESAVAIAGPRMLAIGAQDFRDWATVHAWLDDFFTLNREMGGILRVLVQANAEEADFAQQVRPYIYEMVAALGNSIPAFAVCFNDPADQPRAVRAWLQIYTILDQSNHAATAGGIASNPAMLTVLTESFLDFVLGHDAAPGA